MNKSLLILIFILSSTIAYLQEKNSVIVTENAVFYVKPDGLFVFEHNELYDDPKVNYDEMTVVIRIICNDSLLLKHNSFTIPDSSFTISVGYLNAWEDRFHFPELTGQIQIAKRRKDKIILDLNLSWSEGKDLIKQQVIFIRKT